MQRREVLQMSLALGALLAPAAFARAAAQADAGAAQRIGVQARSERAHDVAGRVRGDRILRVGAGNLIERQRHVAH